MRRQEAPFLRVRLALTCTAASFARHMSRTISIHFAIAAVIGIAAVVGLVVYQGLAQILSILGTAGWGLALVCLLHLPALCLSSLAWQAVLSRIWPRGAWTFLQARWVRESVNTLLPVAQIGGEVVGARLLTFRGASACLGGASVVVDLTLEILTQLVFTLLGVGLLVGSGHYDGNVRGLAVGLVVVLPLLLGFVLAQRWGIFGLLERVLIRATEKRPELGMAGIAGLHDTIQELYRDRRNVAVSSGLHLFSWILTSAQVWLAMLLMGYPVSFGQAIVFFSLGHAIRSAAFLIPSGLGAQEAGFMVLAAMYGFPSGVGLALSLAIRLREIVLGAPGLVVWPYLEGRRILARRRRGEEHRIS
jgi:putative membrane protein